MDFIYSILNLFGFLLYVASVLALLHLLCVYNMKLGKRYYSLVVLVMIGGVLCGFFLRDYSQNQKKIIQFEEILAKQMNNGGEYGYFIDGPFAELDNSYKEKKIEYIFSNLYSNDLKGKAKFLNDFSKEDLKFINNMRKSLTDEITNLYNTADSQQTTEAWSSFSKKIPFELFEQIAKKETIEKEFSKWKTDESAWERVMTLDSLYLSYEYLSRFPDGVHVVDAKRIILDHEYQDETRNNLPKVTDYDGTSTFYIRNTSSYQVTFSYQGAFAKDNVSVPGNSYRTISVPNGYYLVTVHSQKLHTKGITEVVTCNSNYKSYDLDLVQDI